MKNRTSRWIALILVVAFAVAPVAAQDLFPQANSADTLRLAVGLVWDTTVLDPDPHWTFDGEWTLRCSGACATSAVEDIQFDMALTMVRPDGGNSHSHSFTDFAATEVVVAGDDLIILGTIEATGGIGSTDIAITIEQVSQQATYLVEFPGNDHAIGAIGGVVVRSR